MYAGSRLRLQTAIHGVGCFVLLLVVGRHDAVEQYRCLQNQPFVVLSRLGVQLLGLFWLLLLEFGHGLFSRAAGGELSLVVLLQRFEFLANLC